VLALAGCRGEQPHVFHAEPPPAPRAVQVEPPPSAPEAPFGSSGPAATILGVQSAATEGPIALTGIDDAFRVMTMVTQGKYRGEQDRHARIELLFDGAHRAVFTQPLGDPAPRTIAHAFTVPVSRDAAGGLTPGNYRMQVRLVMRDTTAVAASLPIVISVR